MNEESTRSEVGGDAGPIPGIRLAALLLLACVILVGVLAVRRPLLHTPDDVQQGAEPWPWRTVDLNSAAASELTLLPGIGEAMANRIVADRQENGPFRDLVDLQRVPGIGERTIERIAPFVRVD